jgi:two-component system chemotaxis response regulator CheY
MASVLIVDDALFVRTVLREMLEESGHEVVGWADRGDVAVQAYRSLRPDLTLLDVNMPGGNGIKALGEIRAEDPWARVIIMSVLQTPETQALALAGGALAVLSKPVAASELEDAVTAALT